MMANITEDERKKNKEEGIQLSKQVYVHGQ